MRKFEVGQIVKLVDDKKSSYLGLKNGDIGEVVECVFWKVFNDYDLRIQFENHEYPWWV